MAPKRLQTEAEVDEAVDELMSTLGVRDDGSSIIDTAFEAAEDKADLGEEKPGEVAPSADVGDLWGAPKKKKK
jgi:hypothetical protein